MAPGDTARLCHPLTAYESGRKRDAPVDDPRLLTEFRTGSPSGYLLQCAGDQPNVLATR
jgi:hypothetical protein